MKVLYADSDQEVRDYVSMLLEAGLDCEILEASSGNEALSILEFETDIDFVISEVHMKGGDGNLIVDYLDSNAMIIPIVWLSDKKNQKVNYVKEVVARSALNAFVPKPFRDDQFFPVIDKILAVKKEYEQNWSDSASPSSLGKSSEKSQFDDDWSYAKKNKGEEGVADWSLKVRGGGGEGVADWSLKANGGGGEEVADWSLKANGGGDEGVADWSLKAKGGGEEQVLDYSKNNTGGDTWEKVRKEVSAKKEEDNYDKDRFRRIKLKRFYNFKKVSCDVYIQLNSKKYIKLLNSNEDYEIPRIEKYEEKGIKYLFIEVDHYQKFQEQFGQLVMNKLDMAQNMAPEVKVVAELAAFDHTLRHAKEFGITSITANQVKRSVESNLKTLKKLPNLENLLKRIMRGGDYISEHSLMLSYFAGQICMATSWGNPQSLEKLSMAALLHDVGLTDDRLARVHSLSEAKAMDLSSEEMEQIRNHPGEAAKLISEGENIFADVDTIVLQHHELPDQSGFPRGLGALSISPLSCVFILASELTEKIYGKQASEVDFEAIKVEFKDRFNRGNFKKPLEAFLKVF